MQSQWQGVYPALWTPTDSTGHVMAGALADQVRFLHAAGADGAMVLGSTGEFVHLEMEDRRLALRTAAEAVPGWPLIANCSDVNPRRVAALGRFARDVGAAAVALLPPWFFVSAPADVVEFLARGAEAAGLPLVLYNFPELTGHRLSLETIAAVCDRVPVVAVKQSGAEFAYHAQLAALGQQRGFVLISGADLQMREAYLQGARGVVSGFANAVPECVVSVWKAVRNGNADTAAAAQSVLEALARATQGLAFPLNVAAGMQGRGRVTGDLKQVLSGTTRLNLARAVAEVRASLERAECPG